jgi:hypothetical protein
LKKIQNHLKIHFGIIPKNKSVLKVLIKAGPIGLKFFVSESPKTNKFLFLKTFQKNEIERSSLKKKL